MPTPTARWLKVSLFNLLVVAAIGMILRYKIVFPLPLIDQKSLMHAHSHFAFAGWITMVLMTLMVAFLSQELGETVFNRYRWILFFNLATAYGMLLSFPFEGYGIFSTGFSLLSILSNYIFAIYFWKDLNRLKAQSISHRWFRAALLFNAISSLGTFALAFMMATGNVQQHSYLASIYFYLHFQYNGWFFFACMGLFTSWIIDHPALQATHKKIFWSFALACIPAFFLSALWLPIPFWVYVLVVLAALAQLAGWVWLLRLIKIQAPSIKSKMGSAALRILILSAIALSLKLLLQTGSTIPSLSDLSFGFRPIVIGYLHLVLLGVITLFIIAYIIGRKYLHVSTRLLWGTVAFVVGVILTELLLMIQGVAGIFDNQVPYINQILLFVAVLLFTGLLMMNLSRHGKH